MQHVSSLKIREYAFTVNGNYAVHRRSFHFFHFDIRKSVIAGDACQIQSGLGFSPPLPTPHSSILQGMITQRPKRTKGGHGAIWAGCQIRSTGQDFRCQQATSPRCINRGNGKMKVPFST